MRYDLTQLREPKKRPMDWMVFKFAPHKITLFHLPAGFKEPKL